MLSSLSQLIALAAHGNAYLTGRYETGDFYPNNSAFQYCNEVMFVPPKAGIWASRMCADPIDWFRFLKSKKCRRLMLGHTTQPKSDLPDHISAAFVGGGSVSYILSDSPKQSIYWLGQWQSAGEGCSASRPWRVTYTGVAAKGELTGCPSGDLEVWKGKLRGVLAEAGAFAESHRLKGFADCFLKAIESLESEDLSRLLKEGEELPDTGYCVEARQLLAAAQRSWVFGGMGSWNDLYFESKPDMDKYEYLSRELYSAIISSIEQSVNSFESPR